MLHVRQDSRSVKVFAYVLQRLASHENLRSLLNSILNVAVCLLDSFRVDKRAMSGIRIEGVTNFEGFDFLR